MADPTFRRVIDGLIDPPVGRKRVRQSGAVSGFERRKYRHPSKRDLRYAALRLAGSVVERPANPVRSVARLFVSELEDKPWFYDRAFCHAGGPALQPSMRPAACGRGNP